MGQMQRPTFIATALKHPEVLGRADPEEAYVAWMNLAYDDELAIRASAYHIADLQAGLPADPERNMSGLLPQELIAVGYSGGRGALENALAGGYVTAELRAYHEDVSRNLAAGNALFCGATTRYKCAPAS